MFFLLNGCANTPSVAKANYASHFDFAQVKSYAFFGRNDENFDYQNLSDLTRNSIEIALENQLDQQGFIYKNIKQADIIISYFWVAEQKQKVHQEKHDRKMRSRNRPYLSAEKMDANLNYGEQLKKYNQGVKYCDVCLKKSTDGNKNGLIGSAASALIIDLISAKTHRTVWRSSYPVVIDEKDNSREIQQRIQRAVTKMLLQYPKN